jgi:hypothetical protein
MVKLSPLVEGKTVEVDTGVDVVDDTVVIVLVEVDEVDDVIDFEVVDDVLEVLLALVARRSQWKKLLVFLPDCFTWQALAVPVILILASIRGHASSRASIAFTTTLSPLSHLGRGQPSKQQGRRRVVHWMRCLHK